MRRVSSRTSITLAVLLAAGATTGACKHYRVTDVASGNTYYTKKIQRQDDGAVTFRDARTENKVTIESNEVDRITKREFKQATRTDDDPILMDQ